MVVDQVQPIHMDVQAAEVDGKPKGSMNTKSILIILLAAFISASCAPAVQAVPTETAAPTTAFTPIPPTFTITPSPTPQPLECSPDRGFTPAATGYWDIFTASQKLNPTVNLGEAFEFPDQGHWYWISKEETFYIVKTAGFNAVRIAIDFAYHADPVHPYSIEPAFWEDVDPMVEKAIACQLVVIINMHNFDAEPQIPYTDEKRFAALWSEIAEHYKNYPDAALYFEPYNEPGDPDYWNTLLAKGIAAIRKSNPTRPIIIDTPDWSQISGISKLRLPDDPNLIVSFHYYSPHEFTHQCVDFIEGAEAWCGTTWDKTPEQTALINREFEEAAQWSKSHQIPVFLGEFGSISIADADSRIRWTAAVREVAAAFGFSWGYWDLCDTNSYDGSLTFGIYECSRHPLDHSYWDQDMLQALIPEP